MKIKLPLRKPGPPPNRPPQLKLKASVARPRRPPIVEEEDFLEEPEPNMRLSHAFVVVLVLHVIAVAGVFAFNSVKARQAEIFSAIKDEPVKAQNTDNVVASANNTAAPEAPAADPSNGPTNEQPAPQAPAMTPAATTTAKTHELQPGETLTKIAAKYGVSVADLQSANNITDPKKMRAGMTLTIPSKDGAALANTAAAPAAYKPITSAPAAATPVPAAPVTAKTAAVAPEPSASKVKDSGKIYVMVKGDNPVRIAKKFKVSYASLLSLNNVTDPNHMQIGQKLMIPAAVPK